jgi:glycosyltransferase involved in cell wall biosynthesis
VVPGGVDPSGTHRVVPSLLWHIERLARHHDITVVATAQFEHDREYRFLGADVRCLGRAVRGSQGLRLTRLLRALAPDLIHLHWVDRGLAVWWAGRSVGCPFIVTLMGGELVHLPEIAYGGNRTALSRARLRVLLGGAAAVTCTDRDTAERLTAMGVEPTMVLLGADRSAFPTRQGEPPGPPWELLQVGSLNAVKDQRTLLAAFARLRQEGLDVRLTFVGEDILGGEAARQAAALHVEPWVRFEGYVPWTELASYYHRAHLLVVSSRHETGPMVALEAAASGLAVVGTAVGRLKDWAVDGLLPVARPGDPEALAGVIRTLLVDGDRRAGVAAALGQIARERDADDTVRALNELYDRVLHASRAQRGPPAAPAAVPPRTE